MTADEARDRLEEFRVLIDGVDRKIVEMLTSARAWWRTSAG